MRPTCALRPYFPVVGGALTAGLLLVGGMTRPALAAVGDVLALVPTTSLEDAAVRGPLATQSARVAITDVALSQALDRADLEVSAILGPKPTARSAARYRLVRLSSSRPGFDAAAASRAATDLVATGRVRAAMADRELTLHATLPNDTYVPFQWYVDGAGDIHLPEAWDLAQGSSAVVIGVIDTGTDTGHPDLIGHLFTNAGEIPGNSLDDDDNGYVDDVHGWDFGDDDNNPDPAPIFDELGIDVAFHGTAVASVAAAVTDNTEGIAGSSWNSTLLPMKAANAAGETLAGPAGEAMLYAAAMGVDVLNMSFGAADPDSVTRAFFQALVDEMLDADVLCVASAGNEGSSVEVVPAASNGVLAVGSTAETNTRSSFSNYGPWVDVCAPGEGIWAAICRNYTLDEVSQVIYEFFFGWDTIHPYMFTDGTSFSSPLTAGVCAMVRAQFPTATAIGVMNHIKATGDVIVFDHPIGTKVNAFQALATPLAAPGPGTIPMADGGVRLLPARPTPFVSTTTLSFALPRAQSVRLTVVSAAGRKVRTLVDEDRAAGGHAATWDGTDDAGRQVPAGLYFGVLQGETERSVTRLVRIN